MISVRLYFCCRSSLLLEDFHECICHLGDLFYTSLKKEEGKIYIDFSLASTKSLNIPLIIEFDQPFYLTKASLLRLINQIIKTPNCRITLSAYGNEDNLIEIYRPSFKRYKHKDSSELVFVKESVPIGEEIGDCTTVVRFHSSGNFELLERALCNIKASSLPHSYPLVMAQDMSVEQQQYLDYFLESFRFHKDITNLRHYFKTEKFSDLRSLMLNEGFRLASSRYVRFQDYDDLSFPNSYHSLANILESTGASVAVGCVYSSHYTENSGLERKEMDNWNKIDSDSAFYEQGNVPLHSFLVNRERFIGSTIYYFPDMKYVEDYALNFQIFRKKTDFSCVKKRIFVGDYIQGENLNTLSSDEKRIQKIKTSDEFIKCAHYLRIIRGYALKDRNFFSRLLTSLRNQCKPCKYRLK